ncbi:MAG: hypothetical protein K0S33_2801 [Bacteroidetes bacterium]|jgi:hypothetical protein|nr:hypothetical protein [Bacteroidota bacterium]
MSSANKLFFILSVVLFFSCRKEELPIKPHNSGGGDNEYPVVTSQVDMGNDYKTQIYYSLPGNNIVATHIKTDWDLAFESATGGYHIKLNSAKWMACYRTTKTDFATVTAVSDTTGHTNTVLYDVPSGNLDSTAVNDWQSHSFVYIVNRGFTPAGSTIGYKKVQFLSADANSYTFKYASLNGSNEQTVTVNRQTAKNFTCFSMNTNAVANNIEPDRENYDLLFGQFTHIYPDGMPYLVVGMLTNPHKVRSARFTDMDFANIQLSDTISHPLVSNINNIGFDWKTFNLTTGVYTVDPTFSYIIKTVDGSYYKLHFIGFYSTTGLKGSPKFEFQKL